ncbi:MAG TPA: ATP-binding protein [Xanthobacteraceae bacterium]|nr:ATP-binding protein [Xanthobacteraceae bacterium]
MLGVFLGVFVFVAAAALSLPLIALVLSVIVARRGLGGFLSLGAVRRMRGGARGLALTTQLKRIRAIRPPPTPDEFAADVHAALQNEMPGLSPGLLADFVACARTLYEAEGFAGDPPELPHATELEAAHRRDALARLIAKLSDPDTLPAFRALLVRTFREFSRLLPPFAHGQGAQLNAEPDGRPIPTVRLADALPDAPGAVEALTEPFVRATAAHGLFADLRTRLAANQHRMSGLPYPNREGGSRKLIAPSAYDGTVDEVVQGYLRGTPLEALFASRLPFEIPDAARIEHTLIVAGSGHGKTQCLQFFIGKDMERVARGEASVIVVDSQGDMIKAIAGLKAFAPGQPLHDRLCLIDPTDIEWPVALNLFDVGLERFDRYSPLDRERLLNGILELYDFVLSSLLSAELTSKQSTIFKFITRLLLHIPGATIHTFRRLMEPGGLEPHRAHLAKLEGTARAFFETEFNSKQFEDTKQQVARRLWGILENRTFERMFSHPKNKLDLFTEMNAGKVILVNTAKDLLKETSSKIFGRFFIALIAQAAQERATMPRDARKPVFVFVDEAQEYMDSNVSQILEQARKQNVAICCATQYLGQLSPKLQESFAANTSVKLAGGVSDKDARTLSHLLRCTPEFIYGRSKGHFATFVRNFTTAAVSLRIPFGYLEAMPQMTEEEFKAVRASMRARYAVPWRDVDIAPSRDGFARPEPEKDAAATQW